VQLTLDRLDSVLGPLLLVASGERLVSLDFTGCEPRMLRLLAARFGRVELKDGAAPDAIRRALRAYLDGDLRATDAIPVETGGTAFQRRVWSALREIPAGTTTSYGALAARLGQPGAARALGRADALNPVAIVLPCHRVIGADGALTGYAGGLARKRWLLAHEGALP
jgi:methylated-DNA-[protein]-cysteine S-methyltransferase